MVGTPRNCCTQFCDYDDVAWSRLDWAKYQIKCGHAECPDAEWLACDPDVVAVEHTARCDAGHCVLVPAS